MQSRLFVHLFRGRQFSGRSIDTPVRSPALDRVGGFRPFTLHPLQVRESRAVLIFVDHPRWQQRHVPREFGEGQG